MRRLQLLVVATLVAVSCGGDTDSPSASPTPATHTVEGELWAPGCPDRDIEHADVTLADGEGTIIGATTTSRDEDSPYPCEVTFTIRDVPEVAFYQITIGTHGGPTYSLAEMQASDWTLSLEL